ncbi:MAG: helix-turn-helix transcriptional regulator [Prevotella sp.]|nr:helix-turn-helix transcriptional regulator [Prevotella sp.]
MQKKEIDADLVELCPVRSVVARFTGKWAILVLLVIDQQEVVRFSELSRAIPDISTRMLSSTLRTLEADDLICRKSYPVIPPRVEYSLSPLGKELIPKIKDLTDWASRNLPSIKEHRAQFDQQRTELVE